MSKEHVKEINFQAWLELCNAIGFAQGIIKGMAIQSSDENVKGYCKEAVDRLESAHKNAK